MLDRTVRHGSNALSWNTIPRSREVVVTSSPSASTRPESGAQQAGQRPQHRRLAAARRPGEHQDLARLDRQAQAVHDGRPGVGQPHVVEFEPHATSSRSESSSHVLLTAGQPPGGPPADQLHRGGGGEPEHPDGDDADEHVGIVRAPCTPARCGSRRPSRPEIISAEITQIQATPMPTDSPPKRPGRMPGNTTRRSTSQRLPPSVRTESSQIVGSARTACRVDTMIGKYAARKVMNTMPASSVGNSRIATGTIAIAGIGRASSVSGPEHVGEHRATGRA